MSYFPHGGPNGGVVIRSAYSSMPAASSTKARVCFCTDAPYIFYNTGSAWTTFGPNFSFTAPTLASFTQRSPSGKTTTWTESKGGLVATFTDGTNAEDHRTACKAAPSVPYTITVHYFPLIGAAVYPAGGLCWRNSTSGNIETFALYGNTTTNTVNIQHRKCNANNNGTTPTYTLVTTGDALADHLGLGAGVWLQISDDNTNRYMRYSLDGQNWRLYTSVSRTTFMTPDQVGLHLGNGPGNNTTGTVTFNSWVES